MIDVQGAFLAPPEYDLACLLYDLQVDLPDPAIATLFEAGRARLPDPVDPALAATRFDALGLARLCKDVSHVVHAVLVRGDPRRRHEIPRGLRLIRDIARRREHTFPGARTLTSVSEALTARVVSDDSSLRGERRVERGHRSC